MEDSLINKLLARLGKLKSDRKNIETVWQEIADYCVVHSSDFTSTRAAGDNQKVRNTIDITVMQAIEYLTSSLHSGLTNPSMKWFDLKMKNYGLNQTPEIAKFLERARDEMLDCFNNSGSAFPGQNHEVIQSLVRYGPGCMLVEDVPGYGIRFASVHIKELFFSENAFGSIDTVYREFQMTARQLCERWEGMVHPNIEKACEQEPDKKFKILHAVEPRSEYHKPKMKAHRFVSYYLDIENQHLISQGGYYESPYIISRFSKSTTEDYGRSPTWQVLPQVKLVNKLMTSIVKAAEFRTAPPLLVADDGVMMPLTAKPHAIMYGGLSMDGTPRVAPLNVGADLNIGSELLAGIQKVIRDSFFIDQLVFRDGPSMTATEVIQRQQEALKLLGPALGRLQSEYLTPLIEKVFSIYARSGKFGEIPEAIVKNEYEISYIGPVPMLQKATDIQKFQQFLGSVSPLLQINPQVLDNFDFDLASRKIADSLNIWKEVMVDPKDVQAKRQQEQQAQQAQMAMNLAQQAGQISETFNK
jgi:hypothetical protein